MGGLALLAIAGARHQDAKHLRTRGRPYAEYLASTSFDPVRGDPRRTATAGLARAAARSARSRRRGGGRAAASCTTASSPTAACGSSLAAAGGGAIASLQSWLRSRRLVARARSQGRADRRARRTRASRPSVARPHARARLRAARPLGAAARRRSRARRDLRRLPPRLRGPWHGGRMAGLSAAPDVARRRHPRRAPRGHGGADASCAACSAACSPSTPIATWRFRVDAKPASAPASTTPIARATSVSLPRKVGGAFEPVYAFADEALLEIANRTIHALLHLSWVEDGRRAARRRRWRST